MSQSTEQSSSDKQQNNLIGYARKTLENLKLDQEKFSETIFHRAKGIGLIHLKFDDNKNIGYGVIFTHYKTNEKKPCGPLFVDVGFEKNNQYDKLKSFESDFLLLFKEESQIYDLIEEKKRQICLGIDYNIEGIAKDDFDAILCFQILNNELCQIEDVNFLRGCIIRINNSEMQPFYGDKSVSAHDIYYGKVELPNNSDYSKAISYISSKFMLHFTERC